MFKRRPATHINLSVELKGSEKVIIYFMWAIMLILLLSDAYLEYSVNQVLINYRKIILQVILYILLVLSSLLKVSKLNNDTLSTTRNFYIFLKLLGILFSCLILGTFRYGFIYYFILVIPIISVCITTDTKEVTPFLLFTLVAQVFSTLIVPILIGTKKPITINGIIIYASFLVTLHLTFVIFFTILGFYSNLNMQREHENQKLVSKLRYKYAQLEESKNEKLEQFDKLKEVNLQLEKANSKLSSSLAELFTLQKISQAISSIFDMNELLKFINDVVIGVMGVTSSSIALYNSTGDRLKMQVTSIYDTRERAILSDNINSPALMEATDECRILIDNDVNPNNYDFTKGRNVKSFLCAPLQLKGKTHGLVLIEHSIPNAFDDANVKLLEIITQQVSIAIENARLYEQLHEHANTDGLTQVYNRVYFQTRLREELCNAKENGYEVSVIIYDIDNFKDYNDTYGHLFGDEVLKSMATTVKESVRKDDVVARFGGEEFIILFSRTGEDVAYQKAEELRKKLSNITVNCKDNIISRPVTVSMGVSTFPKFAENEFELIDSADQALYEAKRRGKNCVVLGHKQLPN